MGVLAYKTFLFEALLRDYFADGPSCTNLSKTKLLCALLRKNLLKKTSIPDKGSFFCRLDLKLYSLLSLRLVLHWIRDDAMTERFSLFFLLVLGNHIIDRAANSDIKPLLLF